MTRNRRKPATGVKVPRVRNMKNSTRKTNPGAAPKALLLHKTAGRQTKSSSNVLNLLPKYLQREIARFHRLAQDAGLFLEDRALLECPRCGLLEDVGCYGVLMTYPEGTPPVDSGLRFTKGKRGRYICPKCGAVAAIDLCIQDDCTRVTG